MPYTATFMVLAVLGVADSVYLYVQHIRHKPLVCPMNHDCAIVTESKWGHLFGIRNELIGIVFYLSMLAGMILQHTLPTLIPYGYLLFIIATGGSLCFSIFLVLLQIYVIRDYCFYCMVSAILTLLLFVNSLALYFRAPIV